MEPVTRKFISTDKVPQTTIKPQTLSQGVLVGSTLYISGQLGLTPDGQLVEGGLQAQTRQALDNIGHILTAAGAGFQNVVKVTVLMADIERFPEMNQVYGQYFRDKFPARATYQAKLMIGGLVEIEAVAIVGQINDQ